MSGSANFTKVEAFQAYTQKFMQALITQALFGFSSMKHLTIHEGLKGKMVLTESIIGDIVRRWKKSFDPVADALDFEPRVLDTHAAKADLQIFPQEYRSTYLAEMRKPGFQPDDLPYEQHIYDRILARVSTTIEAAVWGAIAAGVPADSDGLSALFDGILKIITDEITATNITPTVTNALNDENTIVGQVESVHDALDPAYKEMRTEAFVSYPTFHLFAKGYREKYGKFTERKIDMVDGVMMDARNCFVHPIAGMGNSSRIIITPSSNLHVGFDEFSDTTTIRVEKNHRAWDIMMDFAVGVQIGIAKDGILAVNEQA